MTLREQALEEALQPLLAMFDDYQDSKLSHADAHNAFVGWRAKYDAWHAARAALAMPSEPEPEWLPTALADPPGTAQWEAGDFVRTRDGCEAGPITIEKLMIWSFLVGNAFRPDGRALIDGRRDPFDITHVRKAVK